MKYEYTPKGVCARAIEIDVTDGIINSVKFHGGCSGNSKGVANLCKGRAVNDVIQTLDGINCGMKGTSCPDQLAKALKAIKE